MVGVFAARRNDGRKYVLTSMFPLTITPRRIATPSEKDRATAVGNVRRQFGEDRWQGAMPQNLSPNKF